MKKHNFNGFIYIQKSNKIRIVSCPNSERLEIPRCINSFPVISILPTALAKCADTVTITVQPDCDFPISALASCPKLKAVKFKKNSRFTTKDGVVFSKDLKTLLFCPRAMTGMYVLPDEVEEIAESAFAETRLSKFIGNKRLSRIHSKAFLKSELKTLDVGCCDPYIEPFAFSKCVNLTHFVLSATAPPIPLNAFDGGEKATVKIIGENKSGYIHTVSDKYKKTVFTSDKPAAVNQNFQKAVDNLTACVNSINLSQIIRDFYQRQIYCYSDIFSKSKEAVLWT